MKPKNQTDLDMESIIFAFDLTPTVIMLLGAALLTFVIVILTYLRPAARVSRAIRRADADDSLRPDSTRAVSVIVFASDDPESLTTLLPDILCQRYGAPFEVIVVNDRASDRTAEIVERLRLEYPNLYMTYTRDGARNVSLKKLALMLGIKAARYPIVLHTTSAAVIPGENWLSRMVAPFNDPAVEVVIGRAVPPTNDTAFGRRRRAFISAADDVAWMSAALSGKPYRGTEMNIAYTRDAFFDNRGFSKTLGLNYGDDDLFIHEIARGDNTEIVVDSEASVGRSSRNPRRTYDELRNRYAFTGRRLPKGTRRCMAIGAWMMWFVVGLCIAAGIVGLPNLFSASLALVILLAMLVSVAIVWRRAVMAVAGRRMLFTLPRLAMTRPVANIWRSIKSRFNSKINYTWS